MNKTDSGVTGYEVPWLFYEFKCDIGNLILNWIVMTNIDSMHLKKGKYQKKTSSNLVGKKLMSYT